MNFLTEIYWAIKFKIEDAIYTIKDKFSKKDVFDSFIGEEYISEIDEKPKKKRIKKKSVKKIKKSV
jgi:hypothetical protein